MKCRPLPKSRKLLFLVHVKDLIQFREKVKAFVLIFLGVTGDKSRKDSNVCCTD
jgi:hypothetical protein